MTPQTHHYHPQSTTSPLKDHSNRIRKPYHSSQPRNQPNPKPKQNKNKNNNKNKHNNNSSSNANAHPQTKTSNRCWDWILTDGNAHYAKNRSSFHTYRRAPSKIAGCRVLGIGTVHLTVRRGPSPSDNRPNNLVLLDVLHMPDARCNGLSISKYREMNPFSALECRSGSDYCDDNDDDASDREESERSCCFHHTRTKTTMWQKRRSICEVQSEDEDEEKEEDEKVEPLWFGDEFCNGLSRVVLWGDPTGISYLEGADSSSPAVYLLSVFVKEEEMEMLFRRVQERSWT